MPCQFLPLPDHEIGIWQLLGSPTLQIWVLCHANSYCYLAIKFGYGTLLSSPSMQIWILCRANSYCYLAIKSGYGTLLGSPNMQILMPSKTPLQLSWCMTKGASTWPDFLISLGMMQRTKWGWVEFKLVINFIKDSRCAAEMVIRAGWIYICVCVCVFWVPVYVELSMYLVLSNEATNLQS